MKRFILVVSLCCAAPPAHAQEPAGGVYELVQVDTMPRPTNVPELRAALEAGYPEELWAAGRQGTVVVSLVVSPRGETRNVAVVRSSDAGFDSASVAAVRLLRFQPGIVADRPVAVRLELPITWQLPAPATPAQAAAPATASGAAAEAPPALAERVYELREVSAPPRPRNLAALQTRLMRLYPPELRDEGWGGTLYVRFRVDVRGNVHNPAIVRSTHAAFDRPTLVAVRSLQFTPARLNGQPVPVWVELPIQWNVIGHSPGTRPRR